MTFMLIVMKEEILLEWNPWWTGDFRPEYVDRELLGRIWGWIDRRAVIPITGCRRSGKTTIMYMLVERLLEKVPRENILFIKCDDERIREKNYIESTRNKHVEMFNPTGKVYLFLDEIQEITDWDRTIKRIYDLNQDVKIFLTGSRLLRSELSSTLAGRFVYFDVYPFSFREFLAARNVKIEDGERKKGGPQMISGRDGLRHHLREYIQWGGFPEIALEQDEEFKEELLRFYTDSILYRDVIRRANISKTDKVERLKNYLLQNISNLLNYCKIAGHLGIAADTVSSYMHAMEEAYFFFSQSIFSYSLKKQQVNPKKVYCVDTGIRNSVGFKFSSDLGRLYENIVFLHLKRYDNETYYWKDNGREVDFLIRKGEAISEAIQVCYNVPAARDREVRSLLTALEEFDLDRGMVISGDTREVVEVDGRSIEFIPLWEWLLGHMEST